MDNGKNYERTSIMLDADDMANLKAMEDHHGGTTSAIRDALTFLYARQCSTPDIPVMVSGGKQLGICLRPWDKKCIDAISERTGGSMGYAIRLALAAFVAADEP